MEVAPGTKVNAWTYDGHLPGPLIRAHVGDRIIVHFTNDLPQPTTIHWHGVRVPIEMDGVPDVSQPEVKHGESFTYDFVARDAGLFWYHPHVMSAAQVGFGLYGALLVEDPADGVGRCRRVDDGAERHRVRQARRPRFTRHRRARGHGVRARRRLRAGERQGAAVAPRTRRRAAALADRQRREEPLLPAESGRPAVLRDRHRRRTAGVARRRRAPHHARRARRRHRHARPASAARRSCCAACSTTAATAAWSIEASRSC